MFEVSVSIQEDILWLVGIMLQLLIAPAVRAIAELRVPLCRHGGMGCMIWSPVNVLSLWREVWEMVWWRVWRGLVGWGLWGVGAPLYFRLDGVKAVLELLEVVFPRHCGRWRWSICNRRTTVRAVN